jgi:hypothetical protein
MLPLEPKVAYVAFVAVFVPVYLRQYGPGNFLWFSDVALFGGCLALVLELPLLASMQAIAVLIPELLWTADFVLRLARGRGLGSGTMTQYMFDRSIPLATRALSLFHIWLPPALVWMVWRMGYDRRALMVQSMTGGIIVIASRLFTDPKENVNWAHSWPFLQGRWPVVLGVLLMPVVFYLPAHLILSAVMAAPTAP